MTPTTALPPPPPPGLPPCLHAALFGAGGSPASAARPAPHIECVGCRLRPHLGAIDAFVEQKCTSVPPHFLYKLAADLYQMHVRPALTSALGAAPEWKESAIQAHYEICATSIRLTVVQKLRVYREVRALLLATLHRTDDQGAHDPKALAIYTKTATRELALHAQLQSLAPRCESNSQRAAFPLPPISAAAPPFAPASSASSINKDATADDASTSGTERTSRAYDARSARGVLRGVLFEHIEACAAPRTAAQPTLTELCTRTEPADVMAREQLDARRSFQGPKPAGRRCFCRADGPACHIVLDAAFLQQLVGADDGLTCYYAHREADVLRGDILSLLQLPRGPIRKRPHHRAHTVFGFRRRKGLPNPS